MAAGEPTSIERKSNHEGHEDHTKVTKREDASARSKIRTGSIREDLAVLAFVRFASFVVAFSGLFGELMTSFAAAEP